MSKKLAPQNPHTQTTSSGTNFIRICFHILLFVTPLLLWPFTTEVFEFNKMIFVYAMTTIIATGWVVNSFKTGKFSLVRTPLDLPILLFFISQLTSTVFSIDPHTSLWGYYSRFHGGLMSTICYIILFYAFVNHFYKDSKAIFGIIKTILTTATITASYGVLEHFGIDKHVWVQDVQNRVFSTLGQPNWLSAYLIALLPIPLYLAITNKHSGLRSTIYYLTSFLYLLAINYTKSQSGLGATAVVLFLFLVYWLKQQKNKTFLFLLIPFFATVIFLKQDSVFKTLNSLNKINPFYSDTLTIAKRDYQNKGNAGSDSMVIRRVVWDGAIQLGLKYPIFGTGLETFGYSYYWVRPVAHNYTSETDFLYNKAHNEYLNFFATAGFFGLFTYLYLIFSSLRVLYSNRSNPLSLNNHTSPAMTELNTPLLLGFISILITNFIGFSVVNIALFFFLFPALIIANQDNKNKEITIPKGNLVSHSIIILMCLFLLGRLKNIWLSDVHYGKGRSNVANNEMAIQLNPSEPIYQSQLGQIQALVASQIIYPQMPTIATGEASVKQKAQTIFNEYIDNSLKNTKQATERNPYNLNLQKNKARAEISLAIIDPKYYNEATKTLQKIIELSPTDPANYYNLGILYQSIGDNQQASFAFNKTLEVFPQHEGAKSQLEQITKKTPK